MKALRVYSDLLRRCYEAYQRGHIMKKIIAVDCREFYKGRITGIGRFLGNFIGRASRERSDLEFILLGSQNTEIPFVPGANVRTEIIYEANTQFWEQVSVPAILKSKRCDLYFSPYAKTCFFSSIRSVITIHDMTGFMYPGYRKMELFHRFLTKAYSKRASAILTDSVNSRDDIMKILGIGPKKIFVCHGSVDGNVFHKVPDNGTLKTMYGINAPYILYVGNSNPHKNLAGLFKAYAGLPAELKNRYSLVLGGVGARYVVPAGSQGDSCVVIEKVPDCDLPLLYSNAELFVFPSFYEGFGLPPLEAMACGCPVASSNASCLPEILGDSCVYFDPSHIEEMTGAISKVLRDPGLRTELIAKGLEQVKLYEPGKACEAILRVFDALLI